MTNRDKYKRTFDVLVSAAPVSLRDDHMKSKKHISGLRIASAAVAAVLVVAALGYGAFAAIHHYWGRGMNAGLQATDAQQQELTDSGMAVVYPEDEDYSSMAVTHEGVTVAPDTVIVDERAAYITFTISGLALEDGEEPAYGEVYIYQGDDPNADDASLNMSGKMYDGIVCNEEGQAVYEDGSPLEVTDDGNVVCHYTDENGNLAFIIQAFPVYSTDTLLGKTVHIGFNDLGTVYKAEFTKEIDASWTFDITLPDVSSSVDFEVEQPIEGTSFTLDSISISPISLRAVYSVRGASEIHEDDLGIPEVQGVILKDGTRLPYLTDGGSEGYTDETQSAAAFTAGFDRVIDVDQVAALLVRIPGSDVAEISLGQ